MNSRHEGAAGRPMIDPPVAPIAALLIVDDEQVQLRALSETLRLRGYATVGASAPAAALALLQAQRFDLLLTDLNLPGMDGIALLKAALAVDPDMVGIVMTGEGTIGSAVEAMKGGALDYILKPFTLRTVLPVIDRALEMRRLRLENATLQHHLEERTSELEAANQELQSFTDSVSHDLRSPLRAVSGFAEILRLDAADQLTPDALGLLDHITAGARRMERLIDDLLRFSRLGRHQLSKGPVDVGALVETVLAELSDSQRRPPVDVRVAALPECLGDAPLVRQVFVNLLSNAFKFTRDVPSPMVEVSVLPDTTPPVYVVRDNGAGFDLQYADKLFAMFQRFHRQDAYEGTGVGLSIAHRIVSRHGGRIWAEAEVGRGATFYVTFGDRP
jgi:signal transduction histidine kinase